MTSSSSSIPGHPIALIGFGEAGQAIVKGWRTEAPELAVRAFDIKTRDAATARAKWNDYESAQVTGCETLEDALDGAGTVFSLVTADQAFLAAREAAELLQRGALFFDGNSCAPGTKRASADVIGAAGGTQATILRREMAFKVLAIRTLVATTIGGAVGVTMALDRKSVV